MIACTQTYVLLNLICFHLATVSVNTSYTSTVFVKWQLFCKYFKDLLVALALLIRKINVLFCLGLRNRMEYYTRLLSIFLDCQYWWHLRVTNITGILFHSVSNNLESMYKKFSSLKKKMKHFPLGYFWLSQQTNS